ncbi:TPA: hypothetical protein ACIAIE_003959 [Serratia fonticola]
MSDIDWSTATNFESGSNRSIETITLKSAAQIPSPFGDTGYGYCPTVVACALPIPSNFSNADAAIIINYCSSHTAMEGRQAGVDFINGAKGRPRSLRVGYPTPVAPVTVQSIYWTCSPLDLTTSRGTRYTVVMALLNAEQVPVLDPSTTPPSASTCTLQTLPLISFSSGSTNMAGMRRNEQLHVICSPGVSIDYTIRLLANSEINGRLLFDSGVSAQTTLNGKNLVANGEKHVFSSLVTSDIDLGIELVGSASEPGVSTATGILLLEAL